MNVYVVLFSSRACRQVSSSAVFPYLLENERRHPFYNRISDGNGVPPYVWGEADLAVGGVRVLDPSYAGKLTVLPKAKGVLLEVED